ACDLLAQAEHDSAAQSILITDNATFADAVVEAIVRELETLERAQIARASLETYGAILIVERLADAASLVDALAPEHLQLAVDAPEARAARVRPAGAIFLGREARGAMGDYVAGTNHVLPTARSARFASGLSVIDFMKRTSIVGLSSQGLAALGPAAIDLAQ